LHGVLGREKFSKHLQSLELTATQIVEGYAALTTVVIPAIIPPVVIDDPDDDAVLACAVAAKVDLVVSGDPHLVKLARYEGIPIVAPAEAVGRLGL
jgi:predicted nucleic acid-binding protein